MTGYPTPGWGCICLWGGGGGVWGTGVFEGVFGCVWELWVCGG